MAGPCGGLRPSGDRLGTTVKGKKRSCSAPSSAQEIGRHAQRARLRLTGATMKQMGCDREAAVSRAARTGQWDEGAQNPRCSMRSLPGGRSDVGFGCNRWQELTASAAKKTPPCPRPGMVWWRAHLAQKQRQAERVRRRLEWIESVTQAVVVLGVAGGFAWFWPRFQGQFPDLLGGLWPRLWSATYLAAGSVPAVDLFLSSRR